MNSIFKSCCTTSGFPVKNMLLCLDGQMHEYVFSYRCRSQRDDFFCVFLAVPLLIKYLLDVANI